MKSNNQTGRGGSRPGAGRKAGKGNRFTEEQRRRVADTGETPLDYMLRIMRDDASPAERRDDMARASAPYVHAKLATLNVGGPDGGPLQVEIVRFADKA